MSPNDPLTSPADLVRNARRSRGLTQTAFAADIGRSQAEVSRYESGQIDPPSAVLFHCLEMLGYTWQEHDVSAQDLADRIRQELGPASKQSLRSAIWQMLNAAQTG